MEKVNGINGFDYSKDFFERNISSVLEVQVESYSSPHLYWLGAAVR